MPTAVLYFKTALGAPGSEIAKFEINSYSKLTQFFWGVAFWRNRRSAHETTAQGREKENALLQHVFQYKKHVRAYAPTHPPTYTKFTHSRP